MITGIPTNSHIGLGAKRTGLGRDQFYNSTNPMLDSVSNAARRWIIDKKAHTINQRSVYATEPQLGRFQNSPSPTRFEESKMYETVSQGVRKRLNQQSYYVNPSTRLHTNPLS